MRLAQVALSALISHGFFQSTVSGAEAGFPDLFNVMANMNPEPVVSISTPSPLRTGPDGQISPIPPSTTSSDTTETTSKTSSTLTPPTSTTRSTTPTDTTSFPPWTPPTTTFSLNTTTSTSSSFSSSSSSTTPVISSSSSSSSKSTEFVLTTIGSSTSAYQITITSVVGGSSLVSTISSSSVVPVTTSYAKGTTLNVTDGSVGSSGVTDGQRRTIIGVVVGLGGAILLAGLAYVAWRVWVRKDRRYQMEDDAFMKGGHSAWYKIPSGWKPRRHHQRTPTLSRSPTAKITQASNF